MDPEPTVLISNLLVTNTSFITGAVLLLILLACSALISGAEVAVFSLTKSDIDRGINEKSAAMETISNLLERPKKLLATILVANNFINIAIVLLFAFLGETLFKDVTNALVRFLLEVVTATFLILLFGKLFQKYMPVEIALSFQALWLNH